MRRPRAGTVVVPRGTARSILSRSWRHGHVDAAVPVGRGGWGSRALRVCADRRPHDGSRTPGNGSRTGDKTSPGHGRERAPDRALSRGLRPGSPGAVDGHDERPRCGPRSTDSLAVWAGFYALRRRGGSASTTPPRPRRRAHCGCLSPTCSTGSLLSVRWVPTALQQASGRRRKAGVG